MEREKIERESRNYEYVRIGYNYSDYILRKKYICTSLQYHEGRKFYATRRNETIG